MQAMKRAVRVLCVAGLVVALAGCQAWRESAGAIGGAAIGGYAGSKVGDGSGRVIATAAGAALGMMLGGEIGRRLDEHAAMEAEAATRRAFDTGQGIRWESANSGGAGPAQGRIEIVRSGVNAAERPCREYVHTVSIGGEETQLRGVACRDAAGEWVEQ